MKSLVAAAALLFSLASLSACPAAEEEDPCASCKTDADRNKCIAFDRDNCEKFPDGSQEHEDCHEQAAEECASEGEGEGEGQ